MPYKKKEDLRRLGREKDARRRLRIIELLGGKCAICGIDEKEVLQIDHIIPIRKSSKLRLSLRRFYMLILRGGYSVKKLQLLCANCHMKKSVKEHNHI